MIELLIAGIILGFYSGISPGPLQVLLISQTLQYGYIEGLKVALAPIITDLPIILLTILFISLISEYHIILGLISILGGLYLIYMAYESFKTSGLSGNIKFDEPQSLRRGATVNFLNPSPYLFWITIGGPIIIKAYNVSFLSPILFLIGFYALLVGSKIGLAFAISKSREFMTGKSYIYTMRVLGVILIIFSLYFANQGVKLLIIG